MLVSRLSPSAPRFGLRASIPTTTVSRAVTRTVSVLALAAATLGACKEAAKPADVASIVGMTPTDSVRLGKTITFAIELRDAAGNKLTGRTVTWSSVSPNIATVDANGVVTGIAYGSSFIVARAGGITGQTTVTVQPAVTSVVLFPSSSSVARGTTQPLTVAVTDANGGALLGRTIIFSSSRPDVATVNGTGSVLAVAEGRATITALAVLDQVSGSATIDVIPVPVASVSITPAGGQTVFEGLTLQLSATTRDNNGNILTGRPVSWTTSNQSVATVSSNGLVTGVALGTALITAESEARTASSQISVAPRPVATIALSAGAGTVAVNQSLQLSVDLRDANGNQLTLTGRSVAWASSNNPVATVQDGVVRGVSPGQATITVTVDNKPASAVVTVTPAP